MQDGVAHQTGSDMSRIHLLLLGGAALGCAAASAASAHAQTVSRFQITTSRPAVVLVYTDGAALVGVGDEKPVTHIDTLRLRTPQRLVADLTNGDVHVVAEDGGSLAVSEELSDVKPVAAAGRHIVLARGGAGIRATDPR